MQDIDTSISFGRFRMDLTRRTLLADGQKVALHARAFDILEFLVARRDGPVTRDEIIGHVWRGMAVGENNLTVQMSTLRRVLAEHGGEDLIVTVPHRGYQFVDGRETSPPAHASLPATAAGPLLVEAGGRPADDRPGAPKVPRWRQWGIAGVVVSLSITIAAWRFEAPKPLPRASVQGAPFNPPPHSLAVLAFANMSGNPGEDYFSDGMAEELISSLSRLDQLRVAARTSAFYFKDKPAPISEIARALNVRAILEGSVRRDGEHLRVTAELVDGATGYEIWSSHYDRNRGDTVKVQEEIAESVATSLQVTLLKETLPTLTLGGTLNEKALDAYLRGLDYDHRNPDGADRQALAAFNEAILLDPHFARARLQRAFTLKDMVEFGAGTDPGAAHRMMDEALADTDVAVSLAPGLGWAHAARGAVLVARSFSFSEAATEFERAMALAPNDPSVAEEYGMFQIELGHLATGVAAAEHAVEFDPVSPYLHMSLAEAYYLARRYGDALAALRHAQHFGDVVATRGGGLTGLIDLMTGDAAAAGQVCAAGRDVLELECLAIAYHTLGRTAEAAALLAKLQQAAGDRGAYNYAEIYAQWGQKEDALRSLAMAYRLGDVGLTLVKVDALLDPIRDAPAFYDIEQRLKFPP